MVHGQGGSPSLTNLYRQLHKELWYLDQIWEMGVDAYIQIYERTHLTPLSGPWNLDIPEFSAHLREHFFLKFCIVHMFIIDPLWAHLTSAWMPVGANLGDVIQLQHYLHTVSVYNMFLFLIIIIS